MKPWNSRQNRWNFTRVRRLQRSHYTELHNVEGLNIPGWKWCGGCACQNNLLIPLFGKINDDVRAFRRRKQDLFKFYNGRQQTSFVSDLEERLTRR